MDDVLDLKIEIVDEMLFAVYSFTCSSTDEGCRSTFPVWKLGSDSKGILVALRGPGHQLTARNHVTHRTQATFWHGAQSLSQGCCSLQLCVLAASVADFAGVTDGRSTV